MSERAKSRIPEVLPGTDVCGYMVEAQLGEGGFGTVFRAQRAGQLYALKVLPLEEVGEWGVREMLTLARVQHPNVVRLLGHGQWPEQAPRYFVVIMEYVPGRRLDVWASTENPSAREVVRKILGVSQALAAAHRVKVVHRDVKEANILVCNDTGQVVLVDFGVGSDEEASWRTGGVLPPATPDYRSPEAWLFEKENKNTPGAHYRPTPSDDLYALGVVLYWLLTNRRPFYVEGRKGVESVLNKAPKPPHLLNPRVPVELSELCLRLLAKRPEERHSDAQVLCTALVELLERQEEAWEGPLCETFNEHTVTTRPGPGADELALWVKDAREAQARPRRGRRPLVVVEGELPAPSFAAPAPLSQGPEVAAGSSVSVPMVVALEAVDPPEISVPNPAEAVWSSPVESTAVPDQVPPAGVGVVGHQGLRTSIRVAAALSIAAALGLSAVQTHSRPATPPSAAVMATEEPRAQLFEVVPEYPGGTTWEVGKIGWKVASPRKPPEADRDNFLAVVEASVKNQQQKQQKVLAPVAKAIATGSACLTLACTGPQVRPEPPAEPCPPGAVEAMAELGIGIGDDNEAVFLSGQLREVIPVREGEISARLSGRFEGLPPRAILKGRLIVGSERAYGRFTEAQEAEGSRTWPICMELLDTSEKRGLELEPGSTAEAAKVFNSVVVEAVDRFK